MVKARTPADGVARQLAALPFRRDAAGAVEVLLLSSRETRRWVIPKGWPMRKLTPAAAAQREAYEEAGLEGMVAAQPVGVYRYEKRLANGALVPVEVDVFLLDVVRQLPAWPEQGQRETRWFTPEDAADLVAEAELAQLLRSIRTFTDAAD